MPKNIQVSELDFDSIKKSMVTYMKSNDTFKDYDFESSALSTIMDLLAFNTHYSSYYLNMVANEMFLDTARMRDNVVSKAKLLGYTPKSNTAAEAVLSVTFRAVAPSAELSSFGVKVTRDIEFSASVDGVTYTFVPKVNRIAVRSSEPTLNSSNVYETLYTITDLVVVQGEQVTETFIVDSTDPNQKFILLNETIDTSTINVLVQPNIDENTYTEFKKETDNMSLTDIDATYFLQESTNGRFEIYFGDNVLGKGIETGNKIIVTYLSTAGAAPNGAAAILLKKHALKDIARQGGVSNVTVVTSAVGGSDKETLDSIKFYAPKSFEGQNRAVTLRDYRQIVPKIYPQAKSVNVWGGEDNVPAYFGKVFISIRPNVGTILSDYEKVNIQNKLKSDYSILTITPEIVDPDYTFLILTSKVKYDNESTLLTAEELKTKVEAAIVSYNDTYVNEFNSYFRYSNLITKIDASDAAITNNVTTIELLNPEVVNTDTKYTYNFNFNNPLKQGTLSSNGFMIAGNSNNIYAEDALDGTLKFYYMNGTIKVYVTTLKGTINYTSGLVTINDATITSIESGTGNDLYIKVTPTDMDIFPKRNQVLVIDYTRQSVVMDADTDDFNNNYSITDQTVTILRNT
tara:strand:+ start:9695 stop:11581 length:1887 start_codon:yes stop_codon:yes gene_type:complete